MTTKRIPALDGWRGIAISLVILGHSQYGLLGHETLHTGGHGVALFFVLSGYLITRKLMEEQDRTDQIRLANFYKRRFRRLMPAAWTYLSVGFLLLLTMGGHIRPIEFLSAVFSFRNYVDSVGPMALTSHFWSLSVEEQFYLIWPFVLSRMSRRAALAVAVATAALLATWRMSGIVPLFPHSGWPNFHTEFCADTLFTGCVAALIEPRIRSYLKGVPAWPAAVLLALQVFLVPFPLFVESILIAVLLLITSQRPGLLLDSSPLRWIGLLSYSLYLWQEPLLMVPIRSVDVYLAHLLALAVAAFLSWYLLEPHPWRMTFKARVALLLSTTPASPAATPPHR
ncbi:MAG TPA: acyltransferase [Acidobacteriaceae bacterium]|nr:acyltransferase [Acidobacteriaceae bacterium]